MFTAVTKVVSTFKPKTLEPLNNGIWYYNYDIVEKEDIIIEGEIQKQYEYIQVRINGKPSFSKCYEAILKAFKDENGFTLYDKWTLNIIQPDQYEEIALRVKIDLGLEKEETLLDRKKRLLIKQVEKYDTSENVNSFILNGNLVWLDKATRVGLMNSLIIEKNAGKEKSTLWFNDVCITISCDIAIQMLSALELYALKCYNKTAEHKLAISLLESEDLVSSYDYTTGYPDKLIFNASTSMAL